MRFTDEYLLDAVQAVVDITAKLQTPNELSGAEFLESLGVARDAHARLQTVLGHARSSNEKGCDLRRLAKDAVACQDAANPRPLSVLFSNLTHRVMREGGNPAYQESAPIRLVLHQLLNLLDHSSLPAYDRDVMLFHRDIEECEALMANPPLVADRDQCERKTA